MAVQETAQNSAEIRDWYLGHFEAFERQLNGEREAPLHAERRKAIARFAEIGFPTTRQEDWRFTNVAPIAKMRFVPVPAGREALIPNSVVEQHAVARSRAVFIDGRFSESHSRLSALPHGVRVENLASAFHTLPELMLKHLAQHARSDENGFSALSAAFMREGLVIVVPDGATLEEPLQLLFIATGGDEPFLVQPRVLLVAGRDVRAVFAETFVSLGTGAYLTNAVTELVIGEGAVIEHDRLQNESQRGFHIGTFHAVLGKSSTLTSTSVTLGGAIARNNVTATFAGEGGECTLNGLSLATGAQLMDSHTMIDHAVPHCASHELYKSILDGQARGVFNGKVLVRKDAQKTDARQTNKTLLLSEKAVIDTKPQLEIFADDVKCTHGATVGQLDEEQVFYLRSRGIGEVEARDMLTFAFASDILQRIKVRELREPLDHILALLLTQGRIAER